MMRTRPKIEVIPITTHPRARRSWKRKSVFPPPYPRSLGNGIDVGCGRLLGPGYFAPDNLPSPSRSGMIKPQGLHEWPFTIDRGGLAEKKKTPMPPCSWSLHRGIPRLVSCNHGGSSSCGLPESTGGPTSLAYPESQKLWNVECSPLLFPPFESSKALLKPRAPMLSRTFMRLLD